MFTSGSSKLVKQLNRQHIINLVRMNSSISAREISNITGLQISTVLYTLKKFESKGYIRRIGMGGTTIQGGKPPVLWDISSDYGFTFGIELLSKQVSLVLLDFKSEIIFQQAYKVEYTTDPEKLAVQIQEIVEKVIKDFKVPRKKILGLGLAMPGTVDCDKGRILYSMGFDLHNVNFKEILEPKLNFDIRIENDANAGALGVKWLSKSENMVKDMLYLVIHQNFTGMGAGFIINHELHRGANGAAGEVRTFLPEGFLKNVIKDAVKIHKGECNICQRHNDGEDIKLSDIIKAAKAGDSGAIYILKEIAKEFGKRIVQYVDLLNPELVIIGGDICEAEEFIKPIIRKCILNDVISEFAQNTRLKFSQFKSLSGAMGGASLIFQKFFVH
ncbi:MAG: ROK family transcriptional regulator [Bacteroidetes bacterium]|nr:ROK family transcriptional regulator [Bacteroidota bacterium]MBU1113505.1 ROK family transcriptional regulator [Bacteroidota bacterium]MBU1798780.1 ROK family transcriptional regulator [Bacteroidota bacterium]